MLDKKHTLRYNKYRGDKMPKRKKLPYDFNPEETEEIKKSSPSVLSQGANLFLSLANNDLSLSDLKLIDIYLKKLPQSGDGLTVFLKNNEIADIVKDFKFENNSPKKSMSLLFKTIELSQEDKQIKIVSLFETMNWTQNESEEWELELKGTPLAKEYIFKTETADQLCYYLDSTVELTSQYSYLLFFYLTNMGSQQKEWTIDIEKLRELLNCTADTYSQFNYFNQTILKVCCEEINNKTHLKFDYELVKNGCKVEQIKFTVLSFIF